MTLVVDGTSVLGMVFADELNDGSVGRLDRLAIGDFRTVGRRLVR